MARFLMDSEPVAILASGSCQIDKSIEVLPDAEAFDTSNIIMKFANGKSCMIDVCRQAPYGYDQRAEVLGKEAMIMTDNTYPNTARIFSSTFTGNADMPYDFFMSRYKEAYVLETLAFVDSLVKDEPVPCSGEDGLIALLMAIAAGMSANEDRWVKFSELAEELCTLGGEECSVNLVDPETGALNLSGLSDPDVGLIENSEQKVVARERVTKSAYMLRLQRPRPIACCVRRPHLARAFDSGHVAVLQNFGSKLAIKR